MKSQKWIKHVYNIYTAILTKGKMKVQVFRNVSSSALVFACKRHGRSTEMRSRINLTYAHRYLGYWLWTHGNIKENFINIHRKWTRVVCSGIYATEHRLKVSSVPVLGQYMNMFRCSCNVKTRICGEIVQPTAFVPRIENPIQWLETMNNRWG